MRVIILSDHAFVNGGATQVAISSLNKLAEEGVDVTFVSAVAPIDPTIDQENVKVINFGFHELLSNPSKMEAAFSGVWNMRSATLFSDLLAEFDPQDTIIHLHTWTKSLSSSVVRVALKRRFNVVCTLHDFFSVCPNGGLYDYNQKKLCNCVPMSLSCVVKNCDARSYWQKLWRVCRQIVQKRLGLIPRGIKFFITVSSYSESLLRQWLPQKSFYFRVRNPIDVRKVSPPDVANNEAFTYIGRLSPEKGCVLFATAAKLAGAKAIFVGCGEEKQDVQKVNNTAEFLGWQDRPGVIRAIQSSRAIVFPSLWHETQGMVVMEAAALGVPAIVSDACAAREMVVDGENGLLFRSGDANDLAAKLTLLHNNPQLASSLGQKAYSQYWLDPCTKENHVKELLGAYKKIMKSMD